MRMLWPFRWNIPAAFGARITRAIIIAASRITRAKVSQGLRRLAGCRAGSLPAAGLAVALRAMFALGAVAPWRAGAFSSWGLWPGCRRSSSPFQDWLALLPKVDRPWVAAGGTKRSRLVDPAASAPGAASVPAGARPDRDFVRATTLPLASSFVCFRPFSAGAPAAGLAPAFLCFGLFLGIIPVNPR